MIDLRIDTVTRPTAGMRRAMAEAEVGDEQKREDPTVIALEQRVAELLGHAEAVYVPTATMANKITLRALSQPGEELVGEATSHIFRHELGGPAVHAGLMTTPIATEDGRFTRAQLRARSRRATFTRRRRASRAWRTRTATPAGAWSLEQTRDVAATARSLGIMLHLDGARLLNASVTCSVPARDRAKQFDTVTLPVQGTGMPARRTVAGSRQLMAKARRLKRLFGDAMC